MHRKPQLQDAARRLQEIINNRSEDISYAQALEILSQLEGFEGYRQLREFISSHSQKTVKPEVEDTDPPQSPARRPKLPIIEPSLDFLSAMEVENRSQTLWPEHCLPAHEELKDVGSLPLKGRRPLESLGAIDFPWEPGNRTTVVDLFLTRDEHGVEKWQNRIVEIELKRPSEDSESSRLP